MLKAGGQVLVIRLLAIFLQFGFVWYVSRYLGDTVYGDFVIYMMITQFVGTLANLGLDILIVKRISALPSLDNSYNSAFLKKVTLVGVTLSIVVTFLLVSLVNSVNPSYLPELPLWTYLLGAAFYGSMRLFVEYYRAIRWITISTIFSYVIAPALSLIILWFIKVPAGELYSLVVIWNIAMFTVIGAALLIKSFYSWKPSKTKSTLASSSSLIVESFPFFATLFLVIAYGWVDKMVLRMYIDADVLGHYHIAYRFATMVFLPLMAFNTLLAPQISRAFHDGKSTQQLRAIIIRVLKWAMLFAGIAYLSFIIIGKFILGIFSDAHVLMYPVLLILSFGQLINVAAGPVGVAMKMTNLQTLYAKIMAVSLVLNLILNLLLIPLFGVYGAAISTTFGMIVINAGAWYLCKKRLGLSTGIV